MPVGLITNSSAVFLGGILGAICAKYISERMESTLIMVFGLCAIANGIVSIVKVHSMPPVILAILLGTVIGEAVHLEANVKSGFHNLFKLFPKLNEHMDVSAYVTIVVIFCTSGFGIYGVLMEGMSGESSILISKAVMDFFTAFIFAGSLGFAVGLIAIPQILIFGALFLSAQFITPHISETMLMNFMACGGILTVAAGFRVSKIQMIPLLNLVPALILVMPITVLWEKIF